jgi:CheY-like chemotaxis protein/two-component sensor histidine kinase
VDDLLDLSRVVHQKLALRYETVDLREQVRAAAEPFEEVAALKRIRLGVQLPAEPLLAWGDGSRIQQIAANLISNGVKFTPAGGRVGISLREEDGNAVLEVEDTGEGIAPDDLRVIFDAFGQAGRGGRKGGLGIGLDLVRRLAELHGGDVEAFSAGPGQGSRFRVRLPLGHPPEQPAAAPAAPRRRLDQRAVLVIEDNDDTREVMKFMLELEGARVETAGSGEAGLRAAHAFKPEIVLCDIGLPDIDGLEVARRIRRELPGGPSRLIALTGYGQAEDVRQAMEAGFQAHLTKPVNLDELLRLLG